MYNTVLRMGYVGNHTVNRRAPVNNNSATPSYIWYGTTRTPTPTGEFASVAMRPYDKQMFGIIDTLSPVGFSWYNGINIDLERRYDNGLAYQLFYDIAGALEATGTVAGLNQFLPNAVPADVRERARFLNYHRAGDPAFSGTAVDPPKHRVRGNFIADLPVGRGKKFGNGMNRALDKVVGGWQICGIGFLVSRYWTLPTEVCPNGNKIEVYGYKYKIEDCTSGICWPGSLWWNGYIPSNRINSRDATGRPNGITGGPLDYKLPGQPLIPWGSTAIPANAPAGTNVWQFWDANMVWIPLTIGTVQRTTYDDGLPPGRSQFFPAPLQWFQDASLINSTRLTEQVTLRFNMDFFHVFNHPNNPTAVARTGVLLTQSSGSSARVTQLRLTW